MNGGVVHRVLLLAARAALAGAVRASFRNLELLDQSPAVIVPLQVSQLMQSPDFVPPVQQYNFAVEPGAELRVTDLSVRVAEEVPFWKNGLRTGPATPQSPHEEPSFGRPRRILLSTGNQPTDPVPRTVHTSVVGGSPTAHRLASHGCDKNGCDRKATYALDDLATENSGLYLTVMTYGQWQIFDEQSATIPAYSTYRKQVLVAGVPHIFQVLLPLQQDANTTYSLRHTFAKHEDVVVILLMTNSGPPLTLSATMELVNPLPSTTAESIQWSHLSASDEDLPDMMWVCAMTAFTGSILLVGLSYPSSGDSQHGYYLAVVPLLRGLCFSVTRTNVILYAQIGTLPTWRWMAAPALAKAASFVMFTMLLLAGFGWPQGSLRGGLSAPETRCAAVTVVATGYMACFEVISNRLLLVRYLIHAIVFLVTIVCANYNLSIAQAQLSEMSFEPRAAGSYHSSRAFRYFRWVFIAWVFKPSVLFAIQAHVFGAPIDVPVTPQLVMLDVVFDVVILLFVRDLFDPKNNPKEFFDFVLRDSTRANEGLRLQPQP